MNLHLGRVLLLLLIFLELNAFASTYKWSASINKTSAVINEAVHLKYICEFSDNGELYTIDFNPVGEDEKYKIILLKESESLIDGRFTKSYEYIAYPKTVGDIAFEFDVGMKKTTQESINYTTKSRDDDRDNEDFILKLIPQKVLKLEVKHSDSKLVGQFQLEVKKDTTSIQSFEPYHLAINIKGVGNLSDIKEIKYKIDGVKVFTQKPTIDMQLTKSGEEGIWNQKFAFISEKEFKIPKVRISYYSLEDNKLKEMIVEKISLEVKKIYKKEQLLDEEETYQFSFEFLYYFLSFALGFLVAKIKVKKRKKDFSKEKFLEKVNNAKSLEKLIMILAMEDSKKYEEIILKVEREEVTSIRDVKKYLKF